MTNIKKSNLTKCHAIIHTAGIAAGTIGAGLFWLPGSDSVGLSGIQIAMAMSLGKVFGLNLTKATAKGAIGAAAATAAGRAAVQVGTCWIPVANIVISTVTAAGLTEAVGWMLVEEFAEKAANTEAA